MLPICCISSWTLTMSLLYNHTKQVLCKRQERTKQRWSATPRSVGRDWTSRTDIDWIDPLWWSFDLEWVSSKGTGGWAWRVMDTLKKGEYRGWIGERGKREREKGSRERTAVSLLVFVRASSTDKRRFSAEALSLFVHFILSDSLSPHSSKLRAPRLLPPQKYSPIKWIV